MTPRQAMEGIAVAMAGYRRWSRGVRWESPARQTRTREGLPDVWKVGKLNQDEPPPPGHSSQHHTPSPVPLIEGRGTSRQGTEVRTLGYLCVCLCCRRVPGPSD